MPVSRFIRTVKRAMREQLLRRTHPALYDDSAQEVKISRLAERLSGKTFAIVGNARSLFDFERGAEIDGADVVVRINRGFITAPVAQGARTDLVCLATSIEPDEFAAQFGDVPIVYLSPWRWNMSPGMLRASDRLACYPSSRWASLSAMIAGRRPSAGLMTIDLVHTYFAPRSIRIYGFDWKATPTFYARKMVEGHHDWEAERNLVGRWISEGWLSNVPSQ